MKYLSAVKKYSLFVVEFFMCFILIVFIFLPMMLIEYLNTSKEDKEFIKNFEKRQKELDESEYRISFFPTKEMNLGPFSYIEKFKGRDNAENQIDFLVDHYDEDDEGNIKDTLFLWGNDLEKEIFIDSMWIRKIQVK